MPKMFILSLYYISYCKLFMLSFFLLFAFYLEYVNIIYLFTLTKCGTEGHKSRDNAKSLLPKVKHQLLSVIVKINGACVYIRVFAVAKESYRILVLRACKVPPCLLS